MRVRREVQAQIGARQQLRRLLRPFDELQPGLGEDVAKARVLPFLVVVEAVEVEVGDREGAVRRVAAVRLHQGVGRALDPAFDAEGGEEMAHEGGLAGAERPVQLDEGVGQARVPGQAGGAGGAGGLVGPVDEPGS